MSAAIKEHEPSGEAVIRGPGWAIQRVGPWVLGHWNESLNESRVLECGRLYREAYRLHGRFQVLAVFRGYPFGLDLLLADRARRVTLTMLEETGPHADAFIYPLEGTGMTAAIMRTAAASVVQVLRSRVPIFFPSSLEEGLAIARSKGLFTPSVPESLVRVRMAELEALAQW